MPDALSSAPGAGDRVQVGADDDVRCGRVEAGVVRDDVLRRAGARQPTSHRRVPVPASASRHSRGPRTATGHKPQPRRRPPTQPPEGLPEWPGTRRRRMRPQRRRPPESASVGVGADVGAGVVVSVGVGVGEEDAAGWSSLHAPSRAAPVATPTHPRIWRRLVSTGRLSSSSGQPRHLRTSARRFALRGSVHHGRQEPRASGTTCRPRALRSALGGDLRSRLACRPCRPSRARLGAAWRTTPPRR